ncbi:MAG: FeoB-associated Cys-rich membrane protein [Lachnospiraceae bacterium]|nr:FeoB-associated Cys-rich membrane protein [Lachnospiraceae bacterium]
MVNLIVVVVLIAIIGAAVMYIVKAKKSGVKCIGCPAAGTCAHSQGSGCGGCSGCHTDTKE